MKTVFHRLLLTALLTAGASLASAQTSFVPSAMSYQGQLTDSTGNPVAPTTPENRNLEFRIYSTASGGSALWGEAQTVTVFKGSFSVILGNGTAVGGAPSGAAAFVSVFTNATSADLYFGITPQGGAEFTPRQKLLSSAFALRAKTAEAVNGGGQPANQPSVFNAATVSSLTLTNDAKINAGRAIEFGAGETKGNVNNGKIAYNANSPGLDIFGGGTNPTLSDRKITLWAEGGADLKGPINFGARLGQHVNLFNATHGLGVATNTLYSRVPTGQTFRWYEGGSHNDSPTSAVNGTTLGFLNSTGFTLTAGRFIGNGNGLTNLNPDSLPNNYNYLGINGASVIEFGRGVVGKEANAGKIGYGFQSFPNSALDIVGAGTTNLNRRIQLIAEGGTNTVGPLTVGGALTLGGTLALGTHSVDKGSNHGPFIGSYGFGHGIGSQDNTTYLRTGSAGGFSLYAGGTHSGIARNAGGGSEIANWDNTRFDFYRRVYISTSLEVAGALNEVFDFAFYAKAANGGPRTGAGGSERIDVSILARNRVVASEFNATSDARLKVVEGRSDATRDLETLARVEVVDYTKKDQFAEGGRKFKKVVAQQVEAVFPQVVTRTSGVVPDIYRLASAKGGFIPLAEAQSLGLKPGETVRLLQPGKEIVTEITEVTALGFGVKEPVEGELFVYGRKVADLRTVDYEGIAMLNVSATQELHRQLQAQAAGLEKLRGEKQTLEKEVAELRAAAARQEKRFAAIEASLQQIARGAAPAPAVRQVKLDQE